MYRFSAQNVTPEIILISVEGPKRSHITGAGVTFCLLSQYIQTSQKDCKGWSGGTIMMIGIVSMNFIPRRRHNPGVPLPCAKENEEKRDIEGKPAALAFNL